MISFVIAIASCVAAEPDNCKECTTQKLCATHVAEEDATLKSDATDLHSKDEETRQKALEKVAHLKDSHENAPSAAAAKAIAKGLTDPSFKVRVAATKLLAGGQEHEVAVDAISRSLTDARKDGAKWMTFASKSGMTADQKLFADFLKASAEALVELKDDRAAKALLEFLRKNTAPMPEDMILPVIQAAGSIGTADAFEVVIERLAQSEGFGGARSYHDVLVKIATAHGGKELPEWGNQTSARWKKWLETNRKLFPKNVAKA